MHLPAGQSQHVAFCAARQPWHKDPKGSQVKSTTCTCQQDVGQGILSTVSWRNTIPIHREKILKTEKESKSNSLPHDMLPPESISCPLWYEQKESKEH